MHECWKLHGPISEYHAAHEGPGASVDPRLSAAMAMRHIWPVMRMCYAGDTPPRARIGFVFRTEADRNMLVTDVRILRSEGLSFDEAECVRQSMFMVELGLRDGDPTQAGFEVGAVLEQHRVLGVELRAERAEAVGAGTRPPRALGIVDKHAFRQGLAACTNEPVAVMLTWNPRTKWLVDIEPDAGLPEPVGRCVTDLVRAQAKPLDLEFYPSVPSDARQRCVMDPAAYEDVAMCDSDPWIERVAE